MIKMKVRTIKINFSKNNDILIQKIGDMYVLDQNNYDNLKVLLNKIYKEGEKHEQ